MPEAKTDPLKALSDNRADFMKRWFAIAISVGFATALSNMSWLKNGVIFNPSLPIDWDQVKQIARLLAAVFATILSWDGYFQSISNKPLRDGLRFSIDVFLVFLYLFLLLTSKFDYFWLWIHAVAFAFYILWDFLSIRMYRTAYITDKAEEGFIPTISQVYIGSFRDNPGIYCGPAITLLWPIYFWTLPIAHQFMLSAADRDQPQTAFLYAFFVVFGLFIYRHDKKKRLSLTNRLFLISTGVAIVLCANIALRQIGQHIS